MGELSAIGSAIAWAFTSVAMRPIAGRALWRSSVVRMLVCTGLLLLYAWPTGAFERILATPSVALLALLGSTIASIVLGDSLYFLGDGTHRRRPRPPDRLRVPFAHDARRRRLARRAAHARAPRREHPRRRRGRADRRRARPERRPRPAAGHHPGGAGGVLLGLLRTDARPGPAADRSDCGEPGPVLLATVLFSAYLGAARPAEQLTRRLLWLSLWAGSAPSPLRSCSCSGSPERASRAASP